MARKHEVQDGLRDGILKPEQITKGEDAGFHNARELSGFDATSIRELADDIADRGLIYPPVVWVDRSESKPRNVLVAGNRRMRALELNWKNGKSLQYKQNGIPVRVFEGDRLDAEVMALADNLQRSDLSSYELAREVASLKGQGIKQKDIAKKIHKSAGWVSKMLSAYEKGVPELHEAWKERKIPDEQVYVLATIRDPKEQARKVSQVAEIRSSSEEREVKTKAREVAGVGRNTRAKAPPPRTERASLDELRHLLELGEGAPTKLRYVQGVISGIRFALGEIGMAEFDLEWLKHAEKRVAILNATRAGKRAA